MPVMDQIGKGMMLLGGVLLTLGAFITFGGRLSWLGRLPGDFRFERGGFSIYLPLATSLLLSLLLSLVLNLFHRR